MKIYNLRISVLVGQDAVDKEHEASQRVFDKNLNMYESYPGMQGLLR